ncbi:MAG: MmgE/PrpD family protein [Deltaproteobacteria bacterium]|nr:MmgE/PrpD family protein [Deltaproteobacteria bacterium]
MPFGAAVAVLYGKASLEEYSMEKIHSAAVKDMMQRIHCITVPELEAAFPKKWPAAVTIRTQRGKELNIHIDFPKGDPENPLTRDELIYKFTELISPVYPEESVEKVIEQTLTLEKSDSIEDLLALLLKE